MSIQGEFLQRIWLKVGFGVKQKDDAYPPWLTVMYAKAVLYVFFRSHKLALHPEQTKYILFTNSSVARSKNIPFNSIQRNFIGV